MIRSALRVFVLVAGLVLTGCAGSVPPQAPVPPNTYEYGTEIRWWTVRPLQLTTLHPYVYTLMEECLGVLGDFWRIGWYSADFLLQDNYGRLGGIWIADPPRIILDWRVANDPVTISHESGHDILGNGNADHDDPRLAQCQIKHLVPVGPE